MKTPSKDTYNKEKSKKKLTKIITNKNGENLNVLP